MTIWPIAALALAAVPPAAGALRAPVAHACVSSPFGPRHAVGPHAPAGFHGGIDLPAPAGGAVTAVAAGRIITIHRRGVGGMEVAIRHDGYVSLYAHLGNLAPAIATGQTQVAAGERLGVVGRTGVTYGTHLYFEIMVNGVPVDPAPWLGVKPCP